MYVVSNPVIISIVVMRDASADALSEGRLATGDPDGLGLTGQHVIRELDTLHGRVVHVADLVQPCAEAAA
jgi:hypothetical protein